MKMYQIEITADTNDGDYITEVSTISHKDLEEIKPLIKAIGNFKPYKTDTRTHQHNYPSGEFYPRTDLGEKFPKEIYSEIKEDVFYIFEEFIPFGEHGIHSIERVMVYEVPKKEKLL